MGPEVGKMGTRALISIQGKPMIATHWDGYPSSLGLDLFRCDKSLGAIIQVAESHTIDAADGSIRAELNQKRVKELSQKHHLTEEEIRQGNRCGSVICAGDYEVCDLKEYGDWAEYEYNIRNGEVFFRRLIGPYPDSLKRISGYWTLD
jgi:hypothetical protein